MYLDPSDPELSWCPTLCGECFEICATGGSTNGAVPSGEYANACIVIEITNRCGDGYENLNEAQWCRQEMSPSQCLSDKTKCSQMYNTNDYGYIAHFDLQDVDGQIDKLGWDNVEVTFEPVACSKGTFGNWNETCYCPKYE